jgi:hypothetical protein
MSSIDLQTGQARGRWRLRVRRKWLRCGLLGRFDETLGSLEPEGSRWDAPYAAIYWVPSQLDRHADA